MIHVSYFVLFALAISLLTFAFGHWVGWRAAVKHAGESERVARETQRALEAVKAPQLPNVAKIVIEYRNGGMEWSTYVDLVVLREIAGSVRHELVPLPDRRH